MAVPTVYRRLIDQWYLVTPEAQEAWGQERACRLMISGSAAASPDSREAGKRSPAIGCLNGMA